MLGLLTLQQPLLAGQTSIIHWDATVSTTSIFFFAPGNIIVFSTKDSSGTTLYDTALINKVTQTVAPGTAHVQLKVDLISVANYKSLTKSVVLSALGGMQRAHNSGEIFQVYASPLQSVTGVAQIGDLINLPIASRNQSVNLVAVSIADIVDALGVDIQLDSSGHKMAGADGDLSTVTDILNVRQAVANRVGTVLGELTIHPGYGSMLQLYVGTNQDSTWPNVVKALIHDAIVQDPRVHDVVNMVYTSNGDASYVTVEIQIIESGQLVTSTVPIAQG